MTRRQRLGHLACWIVAPGVVVAIILIGWQQRDQRVRRLAEPSPTPPTRAAIPPASSTAPGPGTGGHP